jgi:hypothetical protein
LIGKKRRGIEERRKEIELEGILGIEEEKRSIV